MPTDMPADMPTDPTAPVVQAPAPGDAAKDKAGKRPLSAAAERALAEAGARRAERERAQGSAPKTTEPKEIAGRGGLDPTRYGDWEVNGLASDF
jgi:hypothetical protein